MDKRISIAFISATFYPTIGGAEVQLKNLCEFLLKQGINLTVYTYPVKGRPSYELINNIEVIRPAVLGPGVFIPLSFMIQLCCIFIRNPRKYSIIQAHQLPMGIVAGILGSIFKKKTIAKVELISEIIKYKDSKIKKKLLVNLVDKFIPLGFETRNALLDMGVAERKIEFIPNAFDTNRLVRRNNQGNERNKNVVFLGRLEPQKAPDVLVRAWSILIRNHPEARLFILGDGSKRPELERMIQELGVGDTVAIKGFVDNVADFLSKAAIFVLPSRLEGLPISMLEAMAMGIPVVVTPVGEIPDFIQDGKNGVFTVVDDPEDLAKHISDLLNSPERCRSLSENAKVTVERFTMDSVGKQYIYFYRRLLGDK